MSILSVVGTINTDLLNDCVEGGAKRSALGTERHPIHSGGMRKKRGQLWREAKVGIWES